MEVSQLYYSPQQHLTFNNCTNSNNGINNGTQSVVAVDKSFFEKLVTLMDKISNKLSA